jgi:hypothetical protein
MQNLNSRSPIHTDSVKTIGVFASLLAVILIVLSSCAAQPRIVGCWHSSDETGTIQFRENGEVTIVDNMSATVAGYYGIEDNDWVKFELIASDILRDSVKPIQKTVVRAKIMLLDDERLQLRFLDANEESYLYVKTRCH